MIRAARPRAALALAIAGLALVALPACGTFKKTSRKPATMGTALKSRMIRVDADFAEWCRAEAMKSGVSITEVTRSLYQAMTD